MQLWFKKIRLRWLIHAMICTLLADSASLLFAWFWRTQERLCMKRVRSFLSIRGMLLGYSFEPRPNSCVLAAAGLGYDHRFINKRMLALEKHVWQERTRLTNPEVWAAATSKVWHDSGRACFSPPQSQSRRQKKALLAGWMALGILKKMCLFIGCGYQLSLRRYYIINCRMNTLLLV